MTNTTPITPQEYFDGLYAKSGEALTALHDPVLGKNQFEMAKYILNLVTFHVQNSVTRIIFRKVPGKDLRALDTEIGPSIDALHSLSTDIAANGMDEDLSGKVEVLLGSVHSYVQVYMSHEEPETV